MTAYQRMSLVASLLASVGLAVCLAFPWFVVDLRTEDRVVHESIFLWKNDSTFHAGSLAWLITGLFFVTLLASRMLLTLPKANAGWLTGASFAILATLLYQQFGPTSGLVLPSFRYTQGWAPILLLPVTILLALAGVEMIRLSKTT